MIPQTAHVEFQSEPSPQHLDQDWVTTTSAQLLCMLSAISAAMTSQQTPKLKTAKGTSSHSTAPPGADAAAATSQSVSTAAPDAAAVTAALQKQKEIAQKALQECSDPEERKKLEQGLAEVQQEIENTAEPANEETGTAQPRADGRGSTPLSHLNARSGNRGEWDVSIAYPRIETYNWDPAKNPYLSCIHNKKRPR